MLASGGSGESADPAPGSSRRPEPLGGFRLRRRNRRDAEKGERDPFDSCHGDRAQDCGIVGSVEESGSSSTGLNVMSRKRAK